MEQVISADVLTTVNLLLSVMTLLSNAFFVVMILTIILHAWILKKHKEGFAEYTRAFLAFFRNNALILSLLISASAMAGSLFFSEIAGYAPCKLCWFQRILIYPQVLFLLIALIMKDKGVWKYMIPMNIISILIAGYQYWLQIKESSVAVCSIDPAVSCTTKYVFQFGYITIPWMSLSASVLIVFFMYLTIDWKKAID